MEPIHGGVVQGAPTKGWVLLLDGGRNPVNSNQLIWYIFHKISGFHTCPVDMVYMIAVQKPMKGFTASRSTGIDLPDMRERYLSRNVNIGERFAEDPRKTR